MFSKERNTDKMQLSSVIGLISTETLSSDLFAPSHTGSLPRLKSVHAEICMQQDVAQVLLVQTFVSLEEVLSAVYCVPLLPRSFVCGFEAGIGGKRVVGVVKDKEAAQKQFVAAQRARQGAYIVERVDDDRMDVKLGNVPANTVFSISVTFVVECLFTCDGKITLSLPSPLLGTCAPTRDSTSASSTSASSGTVSPSLSVIVHVQATSPIQFVSCFNHIIDKVESASSCDKDTRKGMFNATYAVVAVQSRKRTREQLSGDTAHVAQDFVFQYSTAVRTTNVLSEFSSLSGGKFATSHAVVLSLFPTADTTTYHMVAAAVSDADSGGGEGSIASVRNLIDKQSSSLDPVSNHIESLVIYFVVDRSGSMSGKRMASASQTLICALRNLPEYNCRFQIVSFGSSYKNLFLSPVAASAENVRKAKDHVREMAADMGGTELSAPLNAVYQSISQEAKNAVFLITDGEVSNGNEVVEEARKHSAVHIFGFGVGGGVDMNLLTQLAHVTGGTTSQASDSGSELKSDVMKAFLTLSQPPLTQLSVDWGELSRCRFITHITQTPCVLRPAFAGEVFKLFAIVHTCLSEAQMSLLPCATVTLSGVNAAGDTVKISAQVDLSASTQGTLLHRLCASRAITELIDGENPFIVSEKAVRAECVSLAVAYSLSCKYTSFLAIEKRVTPRQKDIEESMSIPNAHVIGKTSQTDSITSRSSCRVPWELVELVSEYDDAELCALRELQKKPQVSGEDESVEGEDESVEDEGINSSNYTRADARELNDEDLGVCVIFDEEEEEDLVDYEDGEMRIANGTVSVAAIEKGSYCGIVSTGFRDLLLRSELLQALTEEGFEHPSEVQIDCIPQAVLGSDIICQAKPGMGKTAVYVLSILQQQQQQQQQQQMQSVAVNAVVMSHVPELCYQIYQQFVRFSKYMPWVITSVFFDDIHSSSSSCSPSPSPSSSSSSSSASSPHIVIGSPKRVCELIKERNLSFDEVRHLVVDECDAVLADPEMRRDVQQIANITPDAKQVMMFSSTFSFPDIRNICRSLTHNPLEMFVENEAKLALHGLYNFREVARDDAQKTRRVCELLTSLKFKQVIIFVRDRQRCECLNEHLRNAGFASVYVQEGTSERLKNFEMCQTGKCLVVLSTNLLSRGVDFERTNGVINFDVPDSAYDYVHKMGRCGRFGSKGLIISFVASDEDTALLNEVQTRYDIEVDDLPASVCAKKF